MKQSVHRDSSNTKQRKKRWPGIWTWSRRFSQWLWLAVFLWLFIMTDYHGTDEIPYAVNIFFRIDPLVGAAAVLASRVMIMLLLPALFFLLSALIFGRWFCGWFCPLGTLLDTVHPLTRGRQTDPGNPRRHIRFALLIAILTAAVFGMPLVGFFDPFAILIRGMTLAVYPAFNHGIDSFFTLTYQHAPGPVNAVTEPVYDALKATILPFHQGVFKWSLINGLILLIVFLLEKWERRGFCRNICPLGAFYGLMGRAGLFRGHGGDADCGSCRLCRTVCRMGAIDSERNISMTDCNLCMECVERCPRQVIEFKWTDRVKAVQPEGNTVSRRTFIAAAATGLALPAIRGVEARGKIQDPRLLRPPGARGEDEFLARCVRCGECMKVCIGNALHPTLFEAGLTGMFSPVLIPRVGYCEYNCTLCGQVCPTGAIRNLSMEKKREWVIGTAAFDTIRCLPYRGINCMVCEEHCPVPDKAIRFREVVMENASGRPVTVKQPYVVAEKCIGCGICENKCPLPGPSAIQVTFTDETRHPSHADPAESGDAGSASASRSHYGLEENDGDGYASEGSGYAFEDTGGSGRYSSGFTLPDQEVPDDPGTAAAAD